MAKEITQIIQRYIDCNGIDDYYEPFCGGCNITDKIHCKNRYASDNHKYLIALMQQLQKDKDSIPKHVSEAQYYEIKENMNDYGDWYVGLAGFCASYSAKWFDSYARDEQGTDISRAAIRNLKKQADGLVGVQFSCRDYSSLSGIKGAIIYCDPPYRGTTGYSTSREFDHSKFHAWCRELAKDNIVLISEYSMPDDFECIWEKELKVLVNSMRQADDENNIRVERLYKYNGGYQAEYF